MMRSTARPLAAWAFSPAFSKSRKAFLICLCSSLSSTMASVDMSLLGRVGPGVVDVPRGRPRHAGGGAGYGTAVAEKVLGSVLLAVLLLLAPGCRPSQP